MERTNIMADRKILRSAPVYLLLALVLIMVGGSPALAHGVDLESSLAEAVLITGTYSDGEPMSFVKVRIKNPEGKTHQVGNTDAKGIFAFVADQTGEWLATVEDGMGHKGKIVWQQVKTNSGQVALDSKPQSADAPKWVRAVWGLSLLFWLSGLLFWMKGGGKGRRNDQKEKGAL